MIKENRFSKYILYAFGEIILVTIGILIALSINNWNDRKTAKNPPITVSTPSESFKTPLS